MSAKIARRNIDAAKFFGWAVLIGAALIVLLLLVGCSVVKPSTPDPQASVASQPVEASPSPTPSESPYKAFGETTTWDDQVSISVSAPAAFMPSEYAAVMGEGQPLVIEFVLTNNSSEAFDPNSIYSNMASGGVESTPIYDSANELGQIGSYPTTAVLPGQTVKWLQAWSSGDPNNITLEVTAGFDYKTAIYTNIAQ